MSPRELLVNDQGVDPRRRPLVVVVAGQVFGLQVLAVIALVEPATTDQRDAYRSEIIGADQASFHQQRFSRLRARAAYNCERGLPAVVAERQTGSDADRIHSRRGAQVLHQLMEEAHLLIRRRILLFGQRDGERQQPVVNEPRIDLIQIVEAANQQPRAHQQRQRQRRFGHHQNAARPMPSGDQTAPRFFQRVVKLNFARLKRGRQAENKASEDRDPRGESQHALIKPDLSRPWNAVRADGQNQIDSPPRQRHAESPSSHGQQYALSQQLPHDAPSAGAHRHTHGDFSLPRRSARQQQVGHVRAGDQQHASDGAQQDQQRRPDIANDGVSQRRDRHAIALIGVGILFFQRYRDVLHLGASLLDRGARLQPRHAIQTRVVAATLPTRTAAQLAGGNPYLDAVGKPVAGRHHADHGIATVTQLDRSIDDVRIAAEAPQPQRVAEHDHRRRARLVFLAGEDSPQRGIDAQRGE